MSFPAKRRYFDNAATSFPKPPGVAAAMVRMLTEVGGPGRGAYAEAREASRALAQCRERIAKLVNLRDDRSALVPENVVFGYNTTDGLNLAIKGVLRHARKVRGPRAPLHVVSTAMEHNSVLRPMHALMSDDAALSWTIVPADPATGLVDPAAVGLAVRPGETVAVIVNHASNVTGTVQDVSAIRAAVDRAGGGLLIVDGAQSLGHVSVDMRAMGIDLLAFPGHKGLLGPTGTGGLCIRPGVERLLATVREGGTGNVSEEQTHPAMMPEKFEAGSHNAVGIAGLSEGVAWLLERGIASVREHEVGLMQRMLERLSEPELRSYTLLGTADVRSRVGVFSLVHPSIQPSELAAILESEFGVLTRAGLHCAPIAHETCGTLGSGGRVNGACRLSFGPFLTMADVDFACDALSEIAASASVMAGSSAGNR